MTMSFTQPAVCPILIGRTPDLALFRQLAEQAERGRGQVASLFGEAGIGKSRLVAEIETCVLVWGFQCLQGHCFPADLSCPYAPLLDLFRSAFLTSDRFAEGVRPFARELVLLLPL